MLIENIQFNIAITSFIYNWERTEGSRFSLVFAHKRLAYYNL